jgi:hypothetical protein
MIKFSLKLTAFLFLLLSSVANAGLITEYGFLVCENPDDPAEACIESGVIPEDFYIVKGQFEWVWASSVNTETYGQNTLLTPDNFHSGEGWGFATTNEELSALDSLTLSDFTNGNELIHAALYWNTYYMGVNSDNLNDGLVSSQLVHDTSQFFYYDTFYVRDAQSQVPEPSTLLIFAIALIALSLRKRIIQ